MIVTPIETIQTGEREGCVGELFLAGDVGGTKTDLIVVDRDRGIREPVIEATYPSEDFPSLDAIVRAFFEDHPGSSDLQKACFGVAGPVVDGVAEVTNLQWEIDAQEMAQALRMDTVLLRNDLASIANAVLVLEEDELYRLKDGRADPEGAIAVIAPGTGLGEAFLTWDGSGYHAHPSEGGHADFAPKTDLQIRLLGCLQQKYPHVSYERVSSGIGIRNVYECYKKMRVAPEPDWLREQLQGVEDPVPIIVQTAMKGDPPSDLCQATIDTFLSVLGAECSNMVLNVLATGGVYLGGGIPPKILPLLEGDLFMESFLDKGRFKDLLEDVPVFVILNENAALLGAAAYGLATLDLR